MGGGRALEPPHRCPAFGLRALGALLAEHGSHGTGWEGQGVREAGPGIPRSSLGLSAGGAITPSLPTLGLWRVEATANQAS